MSHRAPPLFAYGAAFGRMIAAKSTARQGISRFKGRGFCILGGSAENMFIVLLRDAGVAKKKYRAIPGLTCPPG
jgi:hypothetical protein